MRFALAGLLIVSAWAHAQLAQPTPAAVFNSARSRLLADARRQPRYTCVQNITRQMYRASSPERQSCSALIAALDARKHDPRLTSWDRLQLDVTIADNRELYAWPGTPRFSADEVRRFAHHGPLGTGDFGTFIAGIFGGSARVKFQGKHVLDGRTLLDYTYEVPAQTSHYEVETSSDPVITGYGGSFVLDPQTADIVKLTVHTAELPESTDMCQARSQIEYGRLDIHGREVLIPRETRLRVVGRDGREGLNTISYSSCREYTSNAVLRFDGTETSAGSIAPRPVDAATTAAPVSPFPEGLRFDCRIVTPLDSATAAAGSPIDAILRTPIRGKNKAVLAPRGARIHGRLLRFAQYKQDPDYFEVGVRLDSIEVNGAELPLYATLDHSATIPIEGRTFHEKELPDLPPPFPPEVGEFFFVREHLRLRQFDSSWVTAVRQTDTKPASTAVMMAASGPGQVEQAQPSPSAVLQRVRARLLDDVYRQPGYGCSQNITRQLYRTGFEQKRSCAAIMAAFEARKQDPPLSSWDRLRLDVAIADHREIHTWPGAPPSSEDELRRYAGYSPVGTEDPSAFIAGIFGGLATVNFQGKHVQDGRTLFDYTYEVPAQASRYQIEAGSAFVVTAYSGSFALDPETADIAELRLRTPEMPESIPYCQTRSQIEFGRLDIHGREVLIPRETSMRVIDRDNFNHRDNREGLNAISDSSCHEYISQSALPFDNTEPRTAATPAPPQPAMLNTASSPFPEGLKFDCRIVTPLDSDTAAAGSLMDAVLLTPVRGKDGAVLAPRGAPIHARLVRFARYLQNPDYLQDIDYFEVGVRLESIEINGAELALYATLDQPAPVPVATDYNAVLDQPGALLPYRKDAGGGRDQRDVPPPLPPEVGEFFFVKQHLQLHQFDSAWVTMAPPAETRPTASAANSGIPLH